MKLLHHPIAAALGISTLSLLFLTVPMISPSHVVVYHLSDSALPVFASVAIDFCYLWALLSGLLFLTERYRKAWLPVWLGIVLFLPWIVLKNLIMMEQWNAPHGLMPLLLLLLAAIFAGCVVFQRPGMQRIFSRVQDFSSEMLGLLAICGLVLMIQFVRCAWQARNLNPPFEAHVGGPPSPKSSHLRVIWLLLDELSYQQVYEQRFPGLELPAFDRLASQSVVFTHVAPAELFTEKVLPALFTGWPVDKIRVSASGKLEALHDPSSNRWRQFDPHDTVFQDALSAGYKTGIAGWYNPYCRILPGVLDRCSWVFGNASLYYLQADRTWLARFTSPFRFFAAYFLHEIGGGPAGTRIEEITAKIHIQDYQKILGDADALLRDSTMNFVFLHVPVPHPDSIYDRRQMKFSIDGGSYLDNLVLADQYLAHVREVLEERKEWDSSVVIVMGDHSWRTQQLWAGAPLWTAEEEQASHGGNFDDRPGYVVKMPEEQNRLQVNTPFKAVETRMLMDTILKQQVKTAQELGAWAARQH